MVESLALSLYGRYSGIRQRTKTQAIKHAQMGKNILLAFILFATAVASIMPLASLMICFGGILSVKFFSIILFFIMTNEEFDFFKY